MLLKSINKLVIRHRAGQRLVQIKQRLKDEAVKTKEDCKRMIKEDWKTAQNVFYDSQEDVKFELKLSNVGYQSLPIEYEVNISSFKEKVQADPPRSFDDMVPYELIEPLDYEMSKYEKLPMPAGSNYIPIEDEKPTRPGCEHEYSLRSTRGDPTSSSLSPEQRIISMPESVMKPLNYPGTAVICPHPTIKAYLPLQVSSVDNEFHLQPMVRLRPQIDDELGMGATGTVDLTQRYKTDNHEMPGNVGI